MPPAYRDAAQIVRWADAMNGHVHAFIWSAATGPVDIGLPAGAIDTRAMTISAAGQVTGVATVNGQNQSFVST